MNKMPTLRHASVAAIALAGIIVSGCGQPADSGKSSEPAATPPSSPPATATSGVATPGQAAAQPASATSQGSERDPAAIAALEKMGAYLRGLKAFQVHSASTRDDVLVDGQKIAFANDIDLLAQRKPDRFRAEVTGDKHHRIYLYDGSSFTLFAQRVNYYATIPAPDNVAALSTVLNEKYDLDVPLADLFYWGSDTKSSANLTAAIDIGASEIDGVTCEHYAFRQEGLDWQVWIQLGDYPLPRKLIITTTTDEARPQFSSVFTWNLAPSYNDAAFKFDPPKDAQKIVFASPSTSSPSH